MFERKSMIALAAFATVATAALSPTGASAWGGSHWGGGFGGGYHFGGGFSGYNGGWNHSGYWNYRSYCCYGSYAYYHPSYPTPYSTYSAPSYSAPTAPFVVNQKVVVEGNNNGGLPPGWSGRAASAAVKVPRPAHRNVRC